MFTGSVSLKWSSGNLTRFSNDVDFSIDEDLDILVCNFFFCDLATVNYSFSLMGFSIFNFFSLIGSGGEKEDGEANVGCVHAWQ